MGLERELGYSLLGEGVRGGRKHLKGENRWLLPELWSSPLSGDQSACATALDGSAESKILGLVLAPLGAATGREPLHFLGPCSAMEVLPDVASIWLPLVVNPSREALPGSLAGESAPWCLWPTRQLGTGE